MTVYENWLTVTGSTPMLWWFAHVNRRDMNRAAEPAQREHRNPEDHPLSFYHQFDGRRFHRYKFRTTFLPVAFVRKLSKRFPTLVFNLTFDIERSVWDEDAIAQGLELSGDFTLKCGETICGYFTYESVNRYPAWDYDPQAV